jgi:hypothetical protein
VLALCCFGPRTPRSIRPFDQTDVPWPARSQRLVGGASGARRTRTAPYTIDQYRRAAAQQVQDLSNRRQELGCFIPTSVPPSAPFVAP